MFGTIPLITPKGEATANKSLQTDRGRITVFGVHGFLGGPGC
jgi:hypothetical protein